MKRNRLALALLATTLFAGASFAQNESAPGQPQDQQSAPSTQAQGRRGGRFTPERRLQHLSRKLNLTDDEKAKIKPILEDQQQKMQALRQDTSLSKQDRRAKFQELRQNYISQVRPILNPDQQAKFDQMIQKQEQRMKQHQQAKGNPNS